MKILHALTIGILLPINLYGMWSFTVLAGLYTAYNNRTKAPRAHVVDLQKCLIQDSPQRHEIIKFYCQKITVVRRIISDPANISSDLCLNLSGRPGTGKEQIALYIALQQACAERGILFHAETRTSRAICIDELQHKLAIA